jgi:hypothetical protein
MKCKFVLLLLVVVVMLVLSIVNAQEQRFRKRQHHHRRNKSLSDAKYQCDCSWASSASCGNPDGSYCHQQCCGSHAPAPAPVSSNGYQGVAKTTRYWDCCKVWCILIYLCVCDTLYIHTCIV